MWTVFMTQGQDEVEGPSFETADEALQYVNSHRGEASFYIKEPDMPNTDEFGIDVREYDENCIVFVKTLEEHLTEWDACDLLNDDTFKTEDGKRLVLVATTSTGDGIAVDLNDLIEWLKANKPELLS